MTDAKNRCLVAEMLKTKECGRSLLDGLVARALVVGWLASGCSSSSSSPGDNVTLPDGSSGPVDSGSRPEAEAPTDSSSVSNSEGSVEAGSSDSPSSDSPSTDSSTSDFPTSDSPSTDSPPTDSSSVDAGSDDSGGSEAGHDASRDANPDGPLLVDDSGSGPPANFFMRY
jgi:hypothetical protein